MGIGTTAPNHRLTVGPTETPLVTTATLGVYDSGPAFAIVRDTANNVEGLFGAEGGAPGAVLYGAVTNHQVRLRTNNTDRMTIFTTGEIAITTLGAGGATELCRNATNQISTCSSSLRYKENINRFGLGLDLIRQLKPITFDWKEGGMHDLGLGAEDVAAIEPLLVTYNAKGEVEGVKYDRIGVVLVNAVKEQQKQIEQQQKQIELLTKAVCSMNPKAGICPQK